MHGSMKKFVTTHAWARCTALPGPAGAYEKVRDPQLRLGELRGAYEYDYHENIPSGTLQGGGECRKHTLDENPSTMVTKLDCDFVKTPLVDGTTSSAPLRADGLRSIDTVDGLRTAHNRARAWWPTLLLLQLRRVARPRRTRKGRATQLRQRGRRAFLACQHARAARGATIYCTRH